MPRGLPLRARPVAPRLRVAEAVVARVEPQPAGDDVGDALRLHLTRAAVGEGGPLPARLDVVHGAVGELVDGGLERLGLRHPLLYGDALGLGAGEVSPRASLDVLEDDGVPARLADDPPHDGLVPLDVAPQLVDAQGGQLLALSLAHVEDRPRPKAGEPLFGAFSSPGSSSSFGSFPAGLALTTTGQRILMLYSPLQTCLSSCVSARHDERDALGDESLAPACDVRPRHVVTALP